MEQVWLKLKDKLEQLQKIQARHSAPLDEQYSLQNTKGLSPLKNLWIKVVQQKVKGVEVKTTTDPTGKVYIMYRGCGQVPKTLVSVENELEKVIQLRIKEVGTKSRSESVTLKKYLYTEFYNYCVGVEGLSDESKSNKAEATQSSDEGDDFLD